MSTAVPVISLVSIPAPNEDPAALVQSVLAIKQDIEAGHNFPLGKVNVGPTSLQTSIGAALSVVQATLP